LAARIAWIAQRERLCLLVLVAGSTVVRTAVGFARPTPLYYPDEYLYSTLARSIAATGLPRLRGASAHFPALLGPYLMAPAWLFHDVDVAYRVALGWGSFWFSLAALPTYALARRLDLPRSWALFVALTALIVPDAAFTTTLLSEPFAYPVFLTAVLVAIEALTDPTLKRQALLALLMAALVLIRLQFVLFPAAFVAAGFWFEHFSLGSLARRQRLLLSALVLAIATALAAGLSRVTGVYAGITKMHLPPLSLVRWSALDAFVLAIAAGWVILPGAAVGLIGALQQSARRQRAFAALTVVLTAVLLAQAAFFGANEHRVHERYVFYVVPLLTAAFALSRGYGRHRLYAATAYGAAIAALLLPLPAVLQSVTDDESPSLLGLGTLAGGDGSRGTLVWAVGLSALALATGLGVFRRRLVPALALLLLAAVGGAGTASLLGYGTALGWQLDFTTDVPHLHAPPGTALITTADTNRFLLMKTLFWNPQVTRVLVVGTGRAADGFAAADVRFDRRGRLIDHAGDVVPGPFALDTDTSGAGSGRVSSGRADVFARAPRVLVFGWNRDDHYLETVNRVVAVSTGDRLAVSMRLQSVHGRKTMALVCRGSRPVALVVGRAERSLKFVVPPHRERACRLSLVKGMPIPYRQRTVSVQGTSLELDPGRS
jgi:hypothetical protein